MAGDIEKAKKDYGDYLKIVVNVFTGEMVIGGQWHVDGEDLLLKSGNQKDIWGGGINLKDKKIDLVALINLRPNFGNDSQEILDREVRNLFIKIVKEKFGI